MHKTADCVTSVKYGDIKNHILLGGHQHWSHTKSYVTKQNTEGFQPEWWILRYTILVGNPQQVLTITFTDMS